MVGWVTGIVLTILLMLACLSDLRSRRIPNSLVVITTLVGFVLALLGRDSLDGLTRAGGGIVTGLAIWFPFFAFGMLGAGDVKLFAASATFLGARAAVEGALYTALFGGVLAAIFMIANSGLAATAFRIGHATNQPMLLRQEPSTRGQRLPYALAIAAGVLTAFWWPGHLLG
jgi:prepilin peptidase CpaA